MTVASYFTVPRELNDWTHAQRLNAVAINGLLQGRSNNVLDVTLNTASATTTVSDARVSAFSVPVCLPADSTAALYTMPWRNYATAVGGSLILNHTTSISTTAVIKIILIG